MSYHSPWRWTDEQLSGFKEGLGTLTAEFNVFQLDTKRHSDDAWKRQAGQAARGLVESWKPDLLYTNDDIAQDYVARHFVGTDLPIVFSAVNGAPEAYGFAGSPNVTGVLELEHAVQSVRLLRKIVPDVRRIAVIIDSDPTWPGVVARMKTDMQDVPEVEVVSWDLIRTFAEYKRKVIDYHGKVDALGLLGIFTFVDESGRNVPYEDILRWTAENSTLPDFSLWRDRVDFGTLCSVTRSGATNRDVWRAKWRGKSSRAQRARRKFRWRGRPGAFPWSPSPGPTAWVSVSRHQSCWAVRSLPTSFGTVKIWPCRCVRRFWGSSRRRSWRLSRSTSQ